MNTLTRREQQIVDRVKRGLKNREIGRELTLTEGTVKEYTSRIYAKLGLRNRLALAVWALEQDHKNEIKEEL